MNVAVHLTSEQAPRTLAALPRPPLELDTAAARWQRALDAAERALAAEAGTLPPAELARRRAALSQERQQAVVALRRLARSAKIRPEPWLAAVAVTHAHVGLAPEIEACIFDLDGVLSDSGFLHARAWARVFDDFLVQHAQRAQWSFIPFDPVGDYREYLEGRPRLEGIHAFLASRGISVPEGRPSDPAGAATAHGLARRKEETLARRLHERGVAAVPGARRYLESAGHAGITRAVVSASTSTSWMLELAGLATLVDARVDADVIHEENLRSRPAPDLLLSACRRLAVRPERTASFTHSPAGVAAGLAAGVTVFGVGSAPERELLRGFGAQHVAPSLASLLSPVLKDA